MELHKFHIGYSFLFLVSFELLLVSDNKCYGQDQNNINQNRLFIIERNRDADILVYEANIEDDLKINSKEPIKTYWLRAENNNTSPLTMVQKQYTYGVELLSNPEPNVWNFCLKALPSKILQLKKTKNGEYKVYSKVDKKTVQLNKLYVNFKGHSYWHPKILSIDLNGIEMQSKKEITHKIYP